MRKIRLILCAALAVLISGCAVEKIPEPSQEEMRAALIVAMPDDAGINREVMRWAQDYFIDPSSIQVNDCVPGQRTYFKPHVAYSKSRRETLVGKVMEACINAKNKFGGYIGARKFTLFFVNKRLVHVFEHYRSDGSLSEDFYRIP